MRKRFGLAAVVTAALVALPLLANAATAAANTEVRTTGSERVVPNAMVQSTQRFTPGRISVNSGVEVSWTHDDTGTAPHTATIVEEFPASTLDAIFGCGAPGGVCAAALDAHFAGGVFHPVVEAGEPGLDAPGDSLMFFDDGSISAEVTAPPGSALKYLCAIHPWMQGTITVR